jgi:hypothetical protein
MHRTATLSSYQDIVPSFVEEYRTLLQPLGSSPSDEDVKSLLIRRSEWTEHGAATILALAKHYGTFVLASALALAEAIDVEDGEAGI